ncbi:hypothetical protein BLA18110_07843 [Burkholderia lata]|uniref:hypothetical protein n=1 Tax=Burkholderia lata (strain ATCC 17760 / DSM 23089 / LMG 22485 / NCIMB 9086 / R18194 / 383) TaxID=482957 RepID=UPI0014543009|nr:hypothetical protein [Burkholderia lata]VWD53169.1 hypothetical protein BLA18110_07843 [Burkholderia lata]
MAAHFQPDALHLMLEFSNMTESSQQQFISTMNRYLFASPSQRKAMKGEWNVYAAVQRPHQATKRRPTQPDPIPGTA